MESDLHHTPMLNTKRRSRESIEEMLAETRLAGDNLAHSRATNVQNVYRLVAGEQGVTLGIDLIHRELERTSLDPQFVLDLIAGITGCSTDLSREDGQGYISPRAVYNGLRAASVVLRRAIEDGSSVIFASGHPKNMLPAYQDLAEYMQSKGCELIAPSPDGIETEEARLELRGAVYVATRDSEPVHTHGHELMEELLRRAPLPTIAVADHGFGGATLNLGVRTVCVMDTNDPGVAVAATLGAPVTIVPLNDNCPGDVVREIADVLVEFIERPESDTE